MGVGAGICSIGRAGGSPGAVSRPMKNPSAPKAIAAVNPPAMARRLVLRLGSRIA
ncbi:hypothetical protein EBBID32_15890 [Sphingobium indicum BiD32]|uniref:Uncharacterized protein n=1 Tax=Sphingobium indicum BiD32 TaxID=1301087 RepID=N1MJ68_9SPHN|nr:hypothetical protein EBBID32_15890 [Sphingobium indicum BiD32]